MSVYGDGLGDALICYDLVGSRVICDPPPTDTDQDILVLVTRIPFEELAKDGWVLGGSEILARKSDGEYAFVSFKKGELNYIITTSKAFYNHFWTATMLAKKYNLLDKNDRIELFDAIMRKD